MRKKILAISLVILFISVGLVFAENKKLNLQAINSSIGLFSGEDELEVKDIAIFDVLRPIIFWLSPVIFFAGILLLFYGNFKKFELMLSKEMGIRKRIFPKLEDYDHTFHGWLLEKNTLIGAIFIICALVFFFVLK